jgi:hypothetical protein
VQQGSRGAQVTGMLKPPCYTQPPPIPSGHAPVACVAAPFCDAAPSRLPPLKMPITGAITVVVTCCVATPRAPAVDNPPDSALCTSVRVQHHQLAPHPGRRQGCVPLTGRPHLTADWRTGSVEEALATTNVSPLQGQVGRCRCRCRCRRVPATRCQPCGPGCALVICCVAENFLAGKPYLAP